MPRQLRCEDYTIGWVCALPVELAAAKVFLDDEHQDPIREDVVGDKNVYRMGSIVGHNVVVVCPPEAYFGNNSTTAAAMQLQKAFKSIKFVLMVGIGGGVPNASADVRLGDVVVSHLPWTGGGVIQYDSGRTSDGVERIGSLDAPPQILLSAIRTTAINLLLNGSTLPTHLSRLERNSTFQRHRAGPDLLFDAAYKHEHGTMCDQCSVSRRQPRPERKRGAEVMIHHGKIASSNRIITDAIHRDRLSAELGGILCFEIEAAGLMNSFPCVFIRGISDYADSHKNNKWQAYAAGTAAAYAKELLLLIRPVTVLNEEQRLSHYSLRSDLMATRQRTIRIAHPRTCRWLWKNEQYLNWLDKTKLDKHHGILWIKGKPGTGKSTLMKFAVSSARDMMKDRIVLSFFFNARGKDIENSAVGAYRSLLLQLLECLPVPQNVFASLSLPSNFSADQQWNIELLKRLLEKAIRNLGDLSVLCFIDALDECKEEEQVWDMVQFFERIGNLAVADGIDFQVCLSSRHYPCITIRNGLELVLERQEAHSQDIAEYVDTKLKIGDSNTAQQIRESLKKKSSGIFTWVDLQVDSLHREYNQGRVPTFRMQLKKFYGDILFLNILTRDSHNKDTQVLCIQWVLFAIHPLSPEQLYHVLLLSINSYAIIEWNPETTKNNIERFLINCSKGLVETTLSMHPKVQFIHESVRDFLLKETDLGRIWPDFGENFEGLSHEQLKQCCLNYISIDIPTHLNVLLDLPKAHSKQAASLRTLAAQKFPLLEYATRNVLYHADAAQRKGISQVDFLNSFPLSRWVKLYNLFQRSEERRYTERVTLLYVLAERNAANLIRVHPSVNSCLDVEYERHGCAFFAASANRNYEAMEACIEGLEASHSMTDHGTNRLRETSIRQMMEDALISCFEKPKRIEILTNALDSGRVAICSFLIGLGVFDLDSKDEKGQTPLYLAAEKGEGFITRILLQGGADVNADGGFYHNALQAASVIGHKGTVVLLLDHGANVNAQGGYYGNALQAASARGHEETVKLLLDGGADVNIQGGYYGNALRAASARGHKEIVKLLLDNGAKASSTGAGDWSDVLLDDAKSYAQDSGYATAPKATTKTLISQDLDSDDAATVVSTFTVSEAGDYVSEIASDLFAKFAFNSFDGQTLERVYDALHSQLKALALKLGHDTEDREFRNIMVFIYGHESQIVERLKELVSIAGPERVQFDREQFTEDWLYGDTAHDATIGPEPYAEASTSSQGPSHELPRPQPESGLTEHRDDDPHQIDADSDADNLDPREVSTYGRLVFHEPAYAWFLACIKRESNMDPASLDLAKAIKKEISDSFPSLGRVSRGRSAQSYKATFQIQWDIHAFIEDEGYNEDAEHVVETAITLTGSLTDAQALACGQYLHQTWPTSGKNILQLIKSVIASHRSQKHTCNLPDRTKITAWMTESTFMVEAVGTTCSVAEVGEQFAWIGAALRSSPYRSGVAFCTPHLTKVQHSHETAENLETAIAGQVRFNIDFSVQSESDRSDQIPCQCWHNIFRNPVVVGGYPIPRRSEANTGLELPLNMMAGLLNTVKADVFDSKVFIKSHSTMLVPTRQTGDLILWHFLRHQHGEPMLYHHHSGPHASIHFSVLEDPKVRHIVGWTSEAKILSGTSEAAKYVDNSRLKGPFRGCALENARIVKQIYIGHGAPISYGDKDGRQESLNDSLEYISRKYVILWDVESKRGWMMNGATAFLHLLRASLELNRTGQLKSNCLFEQTHMQNAETPDQCDSALQVLLDADNGSLPIFRDDPTRVKDRIKDFIHIFGTMFAWEQDSLGKRPERKKLKEETFECLEGWDFSDIATRKYPVSPRFENIRTSGRCWIELSRSLDAVTIFGKGLGELIQPLHTNRLCKYWECLPSERYYLAAMVSDVQRMLEEIHNRPGEPQSLLAEILCHQSDESAGFCQCSEHNLGKHADTVKILKPLNVDGEPEEIYWIDKKITGAVCFGSRGTNEPHEHAAGSAKNITQPAHLVMRGRPDELNCERIPPENQMATKSGRIIPSKLPLKRKRSSSESLDADGDGLTDSNGAFNNRIPPHRPKSLNEFQIAIICALTKEADAIQAVLDGTWNGHDQPEDDINAYSTGWIGPHAVVLVHLAGMGKRKAATAAVHLARTCKRIKLCLVVGICGGIPSPEKISEILLGDVVVSSRVLQHDLGKQHETGFISKQTHEQDLSPSNGRIQSFENKVKSLVVQDRLRKLALSHMEELCRGEGPLAGKFVYPGLEKDKLYKRKYRHKHHDNRACESGKCFSEGLKKASFCESASRSTCADLRCDSQMLIIRTRIEKANQRIKQYGKGKAKAQAKCAIPESWSTEHPTITSSEPWIHFDCVASGDIVMKSSKSRDKIAKQNKKLRAFEMEAAGVMGTLPTIVVKGVCDYSDSHKNDDWHWYAAGTAAACTKAMLSEWPVLRPHIEHNWCKRARY